MSYLSDSKSLPVLRKLLRLRGKQLFSIHISISISTHITSGFPHIDQLSSTSWVYYNSVKL